MNNFTDITRSNFYRWYLNNKYYLKGTFDKIQTDQEITQIIRSMPKLGLDQLNLMTNRAIKGTKQTLTLEEIKNRVMERFIERGNEIKNERPIIALSFDYTAEFYRNKRNGDADENHPITYNGHYSIDIYPEKNTSVEETIKRYLQRNSSKNNKAFSSILNKYNNMIRDIMDNYFNGHLGLSFNPMPECKKISNIKYKVWKRVNPKYLVDISDEHDTIKQYGSKKIYMKGEVYTVDGFDIDAVSLQATGFCVPDFLIHRYGHVKGFIKHCRNRQTMADYFGYDSVDDMYQVGISTEQLVEFARDHKINLRAFDINLNPISILSEFRNGLNRPLVYIRVYEHMLGIEQGSELFKHLNHKYTASNIKAPQSKTKKENKCNPFKLPMTTMLNVDPREILQEKDCVVLTNHLNQLLDYLLREKKMIPFKNNILFEGTHAVQINFPKQNLYVVEAGSHKADKELYDKIGLEYKGHGKSGLVKAIFNQEHVTEINKDPIPEETKQIILSSGSCVYCGATDKLTVDHIKPRKLGGTNELDNLQCLCLSCNSSKKAEYDRFEDIQSDLLTEELETIFTKYAHNEEFYLLQKINRRTVSIDINRSYPAGLTENTEPWCRFNATCQPVQCNSLQGVGLYYIQFNNKREEAKIFFRGTDGWFYRHTVEQLINWGFDISIMYYLKPSETVKPGYFKEFIYDLFNLFEVEDAKKLARVYTGVLRQWKSVVTSKKHFIGSRLECLTEAQKWNQNGKTPFIRNLTEELFMLFDMNQQINPINCLPIGHHMLENSMMNLYNVYHTLMLKPSDIFLVNVDEIVFKKYRNVPSISVKGTRKTVECDTFRQVVLTEILKNTNPFGGYKIKNSVNLKRFTQNGEIVPTPVDLEPRELYYYQPKKWTMINKDEVTPEYIKNNNLIIDGIAGTGKSTLGRSLTENEERNKLAFTNKAALNINGKTIHKFFGIDPRGRIKKDWNKIKGNLKNIMIDEFSMITYEIWRILLILKKNRPEVKFMLLGDWQQLPPVEKYTGDYSQLDFVKELVDCKMLQLTENKRSDEFMSNVYKKLLETGELDLNQFGTNQNTMIHIVYTNKKRIELNSIHNQKHYERVKPDKFIKIKKDCHHKVSCGCGSKQDMILFQGIPIIATKTFKVDKKSIANNETFKVKDVIGENITIEGDKHEFTFSQKDLYHNFLLAYAVTTHKSQGDTIKEPFCIHQWQLMDKRMRYTAISRTTCKEDVNILLD